MKYSKGFRFFACDVEASETFALAGADGCSARQNIAAEAGWAPMHPDTATGCRYLSRQAARGGTSSKLGRAGNPPVMRVRRETSEERCYAWVVLFERSAPRAGDPAKLRFAFLILAGLAASLTPAATGPADYPGASVTPRSAAGWDAEPNQLDTSAPPDEAQGGVTEAGTPISPRTEDFFPAEQRDLFWQMDQVVGPDGRCIHSRMPSEKPCRRRHAMPIRGKNTWIAWGEGNEVFWDWVQQHGYGLADFLILLGFAQARNTLRASPG